MVAWILAGYSCANTEISSPDWDLLRHGSLDAVVHPIAHNHTKPPRLPAEGFFAGRAAAVAVAGGSSCEYASVSTITPHSSSPSAWRFTSRQPMSAGAPTSAGRAKKDWRRCWEGVVAAGAVLVGYAMMKAYKSARTKCLGSDLSLQKPATFSWPYF